MGRLTEIAPGVLVATSSYAITTTTVVVGAAGSGGCLIIDPAVTVADLAALAGELAEPGPADDPRLAGCPDWMRGMHEDQVRYFSR